MAENADNTANEAQKPLKNKIAHRRRAFLSWLKRYKPLIELLSVVLLAAYAVVTARIFCEAQRQTFALGRQAEAATEQAKAASRSAEDASKHFELTERPWLKSRIEIQTDLTYFNDDPGIEFQLTVKNVGKSPAHNVRRTWKPAIYDVSTGNLEEPLSQDQRMLCSSPGNRLPPLPGEPDAVVLFPDDEWKFYAPARALRKGISSALTVAIVGCVWYEFLGKTHKTGFTYELRQTSPNREPGPLPPFETFRTFTRGRNVAKSQLSILPLGHNDVD